VNVKSSTSSQMSKTKKFLELKKRLDKEVTLRNNIDELSHDTPDPLMIAKRENNEYAALICALFAYGNARFIVKFLESLDFDLLNQSDELIRDTLSQHYYRFQNATDVQNIFIVLKRLKEQTTIETLFMKGYELNRDVLEGIFSIIDFMQELLPYESRGFRFLIGKSHQNSPYKRWLMYLRWMVRDDSLDMGLWRGVDTKDLLLPLDTHTFKVGQTLGLLKRKSYDLKAVKEITASLRAFDANDPIKYDFALYRLGQEKII
jgi:uncharacterized protein (TIGR02757 family)